MVSKVKKLPEIKDPSNKDGSFLLNDQCPLNQQPPDPGVGGKGKEGMTSSHEVYHIKLFINTRAHNKFQGLTPCGQFRRAAQPCGYIKSTSLKNCGRLPCQVMSKPIDQVHKNR